MPARFLFNLELPYYVKLTHFPRGGSLHGKDFGSDPVRMQTLKSVVEVNIREIIFVLATCIAAKFAQEFQAFGEFVRKAAEITFYWHVVRCQAFFGRFGTAEVLSCNFKFKSVLSLPKEILIWF